MHTGEIHQQRYQLILFCAQQAFDTCFLILCERQTTMYKTEYGPGQRGTGHRQTRALPLRRPLRVHLRQDLRLLRLGPKAFWSSGEGTEASPLGAWGFPNGLGSRLSPSWAWAMSWVLLRSRLSPESLGLGYVLRLSEGLRIPGVSESLRPCSGATGTVGVWLFLRASGKVEQWEKV